MKRYQLSNSFERRYTTEKMKDREQAERIVSFWCFAVAGCERFSRRVDGGKLAGELAAELVAEAERAGRVAIRDRWTLTVEEFEPVNRETVFEAVAQRPGVSTDEVKALFGCGIIDANFWLVSLYDEGAIDRTESACGYRYYAYRQDALF